MLLLVAQRLWPPVLHLHSYESMRPKALIAQVHCERTGPSAYRVTLTRLPAGHMQVFEMSGDEWRLDVRTLVWTGRAAKLGLPDSFRLDRLSGRYLHTELAPEGAPTATPAAKPAAATDRVPALLVPASYALSDEEVAGEDIWSQAWTDSGGNVTSTPATPAWYSGGRWRTVPGTMYPWPACRASQRSCSTRARPTRRPQRRCATLEATTFGRRAEKDVRLRRFQQPAAPRPGAQVRPCRARTAR